MIRYDFEDHCRSRERDGWIKKDGTLRLKLNGALIEVDAEGRDLEAIDRDELGEEDED